MSCASSTANSRSPSITGVVTSPDAASRAGPEIREEGSAGGRVIREATPTSLLDRARKELLELCRRFDETVPYWRVKNSIDAFSDKLKSDERLLLAHEIGADGSFIRWCMREIEALGWQVTNSPVHGDADDMMEAWTHDLYQPPKKTKRRLGRSRSYDGN